ncbi:MAG: tetratricopeptide repeat protein [Pseudomonadota bacterium]
MESEARAAELHRLLVEEPDPGRRAEAHFELGRIALGRRRPDLAIRHFREALLLEPKLERARAALKNLGELSRVRDPSFTPQEPGRGRAAVRSFFARWRRRGA